MSKYIKVDDLQRYCDNQKDHSITPNEFQRMTQYDFGWHTGIPTEKGWYLIKFVMGKKGEEEFYYRTEKYEGSPYCSFSNMKWQKIEEKENGSKN